MSKPSRPSPHEAAVSYTVHDLLPTRSPAEATPLVPIVGDVIGVAEVPRGKVRVRWLQGSSAHETWLSRVASVAARPGDRVLLMWPDGWEEPLVVAVVDGSASRPAVQRLPRASLTLQPDEALRIDSPDGTPLVELFASATGPVVRLCSTDVRVDVPGALSVTAASLSLRADGGSVEVAATDEVRLLGERIKLN